MKYGMSKAVADGHYIIMEPLAKVHYKNHFKSSLLDLMNPYTNIVQDIS
jgi:hypothetical protein